MLKEVKVTIRKRVSEFEGKSSWEVIMTGEGKLTEQQIEKLRELHRQSTTHTTNEFYLVIKESDNEWIEGYMSPKTAKEIIQKIEKALK